jgi:hypothetical protein
MKSWRNNLLRNLMSWMFKLWAMLIKLENFFSRQRRQPAFDGMAASYEMLAPKLEAVFLRMKPPKFWAKTSGTRNLPKKIPYDLERTKLVQTTYLKGLITLTSHYQGKKTFFVFSSLDEDESLTNGLLRSGKGPGLMALLQAPYRYLLTNQGKKLRTLCGDVTARFILLVVTGPRFIYATNPSTLTHFCDQINLHWEEIKQGMQQVLKDNEILHSVLNLTDGPGLKRLIELAHQKDAPRLTEIAPHLLAFITWDGGYVGVFVEQLKEKYPQIDHIPMFSMSTEALETIPHRIKGKIHFLPTAPHTYAEFLDLVTGEILTGPETKVNETYGLLITDKWGMQRYDTQDIFLVKELVSGLPDLRFIKRRGVTSSLTGEKITEEQVIMMIQMLKTQFPELKHASLSLLPVEQLRSFNYHLLIIGLDKVDIKLILKKSEELLQQINHEYRSKVDSGRLGPLSLELTSVSKLAALMGAPAHWESQFKVMPLYEKVIRKD